MFLPTIACVGMPLEHARVVSSVGDAYMFRQRKALVKASWRTQRRAAVVFKREGGGRRYGG